jgi:poly(A) polymerase
VPKLPITGGALIERGLKPGPAVGKAMKFIERQWVASGFPSGEELERIVAAALQAK